MSHTRLYPSAAAPSNPKHLLAGLSLCWPLQSARATAQSFRLGLVMVQMAYTLQAVVARIDCFPAFVSSLHVYCGLLRRGFQEVLNLRDSSAWHGLVMKQKKREKSNKQLRNSDSVPTHCSLQGESQKAYGLCHQAAPGLSIC